MYCWGGNNGNASPAVLNSAFVNNSAIDGGGIVCDNLNSFPGSSGNSDPDFVNCIFRGNSASGIGPQFFILGTATFHATYSNIDITNQATPHVITGSTTGNISTDPLFMDALMATGNDGIWLTSDDGLLMQSNSTCINTGTNTGLPAFDILGNSRIFASVVDMGPYEEQSVSTSAISNTTVNTGICIYPNPSNGFFTAESKITEPISYQILDALGKAIEYGLLTNESNVIDLRSLKKGIYLFRTQYDLVRVAIQ